MFLASCVMSKFMYVCLSQGQTDSEVNKSALKYNFYENVGNELPSSVNMSKLHNMFMQRTYWYEYG